MQVIISSDKNERDKLFSSLRLNKQTAEERYKLETFLCEKANNSSYGKFAKNTTGMISVPVVYIR